MSQPLIIVGAGLAGCSATAALVRQGWQVRLIDRQAAPAMEAWARAIAQASSARANAGR